LGHAVHAGETIGVVVNVVGDNRRTASPGANGLAEAVAGGIVAVLEVAAIAVAGGGQAIERVVAVVDRRRGRALRRGKDKVGDGPRGKVRFEVRQDDGRWRARGRRGWQSRPPPCRRRSRRAGQNKSTDSQKGGWDPFNPKIRARYFTFGCAVETAAALAVAEQMGTKD